MLEVYLSALDPFKTVFSPIFTTPINTADLAGESFLGEKCFYDANGRNPFYYSKTKM